MNISITHPTDRPNFSIVTLGARSVAFSYDTPIGFKLYPYHRWTTRVNDWGPTTGKHLNYLNDDTDRLDSDEFESRLAAFYEGA